MESERVSTLLKEKKAIASIQISFLTGRGEITFPLPALPVHKWGGITIALEIEQLGRKFNSRV